MSRASLDERPLLDNGTEKFEQDVYVPLGPRRQNSSTKAWLYVSLLLNLALSITVAILINRLRHSVSWVGPKALYSACATDLTLILSGRLSLSSRERLPFGLASSYFTSPGG